VKTEARVFLGVTAFFVVIGLVYWFTSYEHAGSVMLAASALMGLLAGLSIWLLARGTPTRAEDRPDATVAEGAGTVDVFPTQSIWPFAVGLSGALLASGFAFGAWLVLVGSAVFAVSLIGMVREARNETVPRRAAHDGGETSSSASST
jgi:hypothetical protein